MKNEPLSSLDRRNFLAVGSAATVTAITQPIDLSADTDRGHTARPPLSFQEHVDAVGLAQANQELEEGHFPVTTKRFYMDWEIGQEIQIHERLAFQYKRSSKQRCWQSLAEHLESGGHPWGTVYLQDPIRPVHHWWLFGSIKKPRYTVVYVTSDSSSRICCANQSLMQSVTSNVHKIEDYRRIPMESMGRALRRVNRDILRSVERTPFFECDCRRHV